MYRLIFSEEKNPRRITTAAYKESRPSTKSAIRYIILLLAVGKGFQSGYRKSKDINFFQDIGDFTSFDLEGVANKGWYQWYDQIIMVVLQEMRTGE